MKNLIIERLNSLQKLKEDTKVIPSEINEFELKKNISDIFEKELSSLIDEGKIKIVGTTIRKQRILSI